MGKNKVTHFEVPSSDLKKSKEFYEKIFDWKINMTENENEKSDEEMEYAVAYTTKVDKEMNPIEMGGINGGFYKRKSKSQQPSIVVETDSIDSTLAKVEEAGGKITTPKHDIGEWGFMAEFTDPDGNEISLWETSK